MGRYTWSDVVPLVARSIVLGCVETLSGANAVDIVTLLYQGHDDDPPVEIAGWSCSQTEDTLGENQRVLPEFKCQKGDAVVYLVNEHPDSHVGENDIAAISTDQVALATFIVDMGCLWVKIEANAIVQWTA